VVQLKQFGKYEIVRKLGRSMTDVYLGHDPETGRPVVLKIIEEARDEYTQLVIEAERRGAQIQEQLHQLDPRIIEIYEYGVQGGCFFVAMAYFEGKNIAEVLQAERRLEPLRAVRYAAEVCSQLNRLHAFVSDVDGQRRAVVHGDIKPSNIQIGANDEVRLLDFGIAKVITYTHNLTHHNLGSPTYCSPERLSKAQVDAQSDLWAVGVSLYEMVGGSPPYQAQDTRKLENLIQSRRPPRALPAGCPAPVRAVIAKALAPDIRRRYPSAAAFESDLRAILLNLPTAAETEKHGTWEANATIQKSPLEPPAPHRGKSRFWTFPWAKLRAPAPRKEKGVWFALAAGIVCGLLLAPLHYLYAFHSASQPLRPPLDLSRSNAAQISQTWDLYQRLEHQNAFLGRWSPALPLNESMWAALVQASNDVIEGYRNSSDPAISDFDWKKARLCLRYALRIRPSDPEARGKLALCDGYINLAANPRLPAAAASERNFLLAAASLPRSPDPHLALARLYTYSFNNAGRAAAEFIAAERRGYRNGPREFEAQGDGYLLRAEYELRQARHANASRREQSRWLSAARDDLERARTLYEPIAGFSRVSLDLEQLDRDRNEQQQLLSAQLAAARLAGRVKGKRNGRRSKQPVRRRQLASSTLWR